MSKTIIKCAAFLFLCSLSLVSCNKDWDEPTSAAYGNNSINEENIISIADLKTQYKDVIYASTDTYKKIDKDIKIRGRVTGNDLGSNIYKQVVIQDATGGMILSVNQSGMHAFLPEGQEIIVALQDLYIGGYRKQPQIGMPYWNDDQKHKAVELGRMYKELFQQHFKLVGTPDVTKIDTLKGFTPALDKEQHSAKLVRIENVSFKPVYGLGTFAPDSTVDETVAIVGGCVNRELNEYTANQVVVRTSTYAKFAARKMPYNAEEKKPIKCNLVGIANRYNDVWQIMIRKESDIEILDN